MSHSTAMTVDRRRFLALPGAIAGAGLLAACGGGQGAGSGGGGGGEGGLTKNVRFGHPSPAHGVYNFAQYPLLDEILQEQYGVGVRPKVFRGYTPMAAGFLSGEIDIAYMTLPSLIKAKNQDLPFVAILGYTKQFGHALVTNPDIDDFGGLAGKNIAVQSPASQATQIGKIMVEDELGDVSAVNYRDITSTPDRLAALRAGEVQAAVVFFAGGLQAERDGYARLLATPWDYDRLSDQTVLAMTVHVETLRKRAEALEAITAALVEAYGNAGEADPQELTERALATGEYAEFDKDVWAETLRNAQEIGMWADGGVITEERYEKAREGLVASGLIEADEWMPYAEIVDDTFMN